MWMIQPQTMYIYIYIYIYKLYSLFLGANNCGASPPNCGGDSFWGLNHFERVPVKGTHRLLVKMSEIDFRFPLEPLVEEWWNPFGLYITSDDSIMIIVK